MLFFVSMLNRYVVVCSIVLHVVLYRYCCTLPAMGVKRVDIFATAVEYMSGLLETMVTADATLSTFVQCVEDTFVKLLDHEKHGSNVPYRRFSCLRS